MFIEELMPSLRSGKTIFRKDSNKIIFIKIQNNQIYKKFLMKDLMTDWANSQINDQDVIKDDWQIY